MWTHANSGNAVFEATGSRAAIERAMERALEAAIGLRGDDVRAHRGRAPPRRRLEPFPVAGGDTYFITFLKQAPPAAVKRALEAASNDFDTLDVHGRDVHWRMRGKSTDTKIKAATWRRWASTPAPAATSTC